MENKEMISSKKTFEIIAPIKKKPMPIMIPNIIISLFFIIITSTIGYNKYIE